MAAMDEIGQLMKWEASLTLPDGSVESDFIQIADTFLLDKTECLF